MLLYYDAPDNKYVINNDIFLLLEVTTRTRDENTGKKHNSYNRTTGQRCAFVTSRR